MVIGFALDPKTHDELAEDPRDLVANWAPEIAKGLSVSAEHFTALYLFASATDQLLVAIAFPG